MKTNLLLYLLCIANSGFAQQNLCPNPSFEIYDPDSCPNALGQISKAIGWYLSRGTPDYYNSCAQTASYVSVPFAGFGYRTAASGNAFAGIIAKEPLNDNNSERMGAKLITPLQIGTRYYASFKVSLAGVHGNKFNQCAINKLGILFSTIHYDSNSFSPICSNCAQVFTNSIITDTLNWTMIKGSFIADSNYSYINVGRFNPNSTTDSVQFSGTECNAYYYIDNVCVSTDSVYAFNYVYAGITDENEDESLICFPDPVEDFLTVQDNITGIEGIRIYNIQGQLVQSCSIASLKTYAINISVLPKGIYYLSILRKNKNQINKLIIKQ